MIKQRKLIKINDALSKWHGAAAEFRNFSDSMSNKLVLSLFKDDVEEQLQLGACQYIRTKVYLNNVALHCDATVFEGHDSFLIKDLNSDLEIIVGSAIKIGEIIVTAGD